MKNFNVLFNIIFLLATAGLINNVYAEDLQVACCDVAEPEEKEDSMSKLKRYIVEGHKLVDEFNSIMDRYEGNLKKFSDFRKQCLADRSAALKFGGEFLEAYNQTDCGDASTLVTKLRQNALLLDEVEVEIKDLKEKIQFSERTLYRAEEIEEVSSEADEIRNKLINARDGHSSLESTVE